MSYSNSNSGDRWKTGSTRFPIDDDGPDRAGTSKKRKWIWFGTGLALLIVLAVVIPVVYTVVHKQQIRSGISSSSSSNPTSTSTSSGGTGTNTGTGTGTQTTTTFNPIDPLTGPDPSNLSPQSGTSGSTVTTYVNGTKATFTYTNNFGGSWAIDPLNPWNVSGQAQSWVPKITEEWVWGKDTIRGVNLGGW